MNGDELQELLSMIPFIRPGFFEMQETPAISGRDFDYRCRIKIAAKLARSLRHKIGKGGIS